ncbi:MAG: RNA methyltransferase [Planctomycetaceae bacterium]|nr:RNA methyltransferase [Planctomycetaceae bacterium]
MTEIFLDNLDDTRLEPYRDLKRTNRTRRAETFIAEGRFVVERLLASDYEVESVLVSEKKRHLFPEEYLDRAPLMVMPHSLMEELIGFNFHQGFLACGRRKQNVVAPSPEQNQPSLLLACPHITDPDNLGTIMRLARAFGVDSLLVGEQSTDPFSRRVIRVSMGNIFFLPIITPTDFASALIQLKEEAGYDLVATVLNEEAESLMEQSRPAQMVLLFGNEAEGLDPRWLELADRQVTIPMDAGTDSLNVALSVGIFLYHYTRIAN